MVKTKLRNASGASFSRTAFKLRGSDFLQPDALVLTSKSMAQTPSLGADLGGSSVGALQGNGSALMHPMTPLACSNPFQPR